MFWREPVSNSSHALDGCVYVMIEYYKAFSLFFFLFLFSWSQIALMLATRKLPDASFYLKETQGIPNDLSWVPLTTMLECNWDTGCHGDKMGSVTKEGAAVMTRTDSGCKAYLWFSLNIISPSFDHAFITILIFAGAWFSPWIRLQTQACTPCPNEAKSPSHPSAEGWPFGKLTLLKPLTNSVHTLAAPLYTKQGFGRAPHLSHVWVIIVGAGFGLA